jgi:hypothetical protein
MHLHLSFQIIPIFYETNTKTYASCLLWRPITFATRDMHGPPLIAKYQWNDLKGRHTYIVPVPSHWSHGRASNSGPIIGTAHMLT